MAEVFRARNLDAPEWMRSLALKRLRPELGERAELVDQLRAEAVLTSMLVHPSIAQAIDVVDDGRHMAIVFEWLEGADLLRILEAAARKGANLPVPAVVAIIARVASALGHFHTTAGPDGARGWVHRDVSPGNIVLTHAGGVKLIDFGVATNPAAHPGEVPRRGKLGYFAPETVLFGTVSPASDLFALATVLWESLVLRRLFKVGDDADTLRNIANVNVESRFSRYPAVPPDLMAIIRRALEPNPFARHPDMLSFEADLLGWLTKQGLFVTDRELGELVRSFVPQPYEEPLHAGRRLPTVETPALLDLSGLEALIDHLGEEPPEAGLRRFMAGEESWVPERIRAAIHGEIAEVMTTEDTAPEAGFSAIASDTHRATTLGRFDPWVFPALMCSLEQQSFTGVVSVTMRKHRKQLHFMHGRVSHLTTNIASERLASRLERAGLIRAETRQRALELQRRTGMPIGEAIVTMDASRSEAVREALQQELDERFAELLGWPDGQVTIESLETAVSAERCPPHAEWRSPELLVAATVRAHWTDAELSLLLAPWSDMPFRPISNRLGRPAWVRPDEADAWDALSQGMTPNGTQRAFPAAPVTLLTYLGIVTCRLFQEHTTRRRRPAHVPPDLPWVSTPPTH